MSLEGPGSTRKTILCIAYPFWDVTAGTGRSGAGKLQSLSLCALNDLITSQPEHVITKTEAYISGQGVDAASPHLLLYSSSLSCSSLSVFYGRVPIRTHSTYHVCQGYCRGG